MSIKFFGKVDRNRDGEIKSEYPAYMLVSQKEALEEEVAALQRLVKDPGMDYESRFKKEEELGKAKTQLALITKSEPKLKAAEKDRLAKNYKDLSERIGASMFSYDEMHKATADAHKEARRMVEPCIEVDPEIAKECGVRVDGRNMASRNGASKMFKILGYHLGDETNVETLRRIRRG